MDVVLADGSLRTIDAESDLWWAMKGAGHNFGIVTKVTTKVFDIKHRGWARETMIFTGDKVEAVFDSINKNILKNGTQDIDVVNWAYMLNIPALDANKVRCVANRSARSNFYSLLSFFTCFKKASKLSKRSTLRHLRPLALLMSRTSQVATWTFQGGP